MPEAQLHRPDEPTLRARFPSPKRIQEIKYWLRASRQVLPQIPNTEKTDWRISGDVEISVSQIKIELTNSVGERATVIIDRTKPALGV